MRSRAVRITLTLLVITAFAASAYLSWTIHSRAEAESQASAAFEATRLAALREAHEVRATQQAYVAAGQNEAFWFDKVTRGIESLRGGLTELRSSPSSAAAAASLEEAETAVVEFERLDRRARGYATTGQKLLAADVIYADGIAAAGRITTALEKAGAEMAEATSVSRSASVRQQAMTIGGAAAFAILAVLLLTPVAAQQPALQTAAAVQEPAGGSLRLRDDPKAPERRATTSRDPRDSRDVQRRKAVPGPGSAGGPARPASPVPPAAQAPPPPSVELQSLAAVCTDLARLSDTTLLPEILERAAAALNASGLVLWIVDANGTTLQPIATHGYPASVVSRMGSLNLDGQNATVAAFRTGLLQTVSAGSGTHGAIAVPLLSPAGCRGVLSAEVRHDAEKQPARLAAASIVAAQLATLVGPPAAASTQDRNTATL